MTTNKKESPREAWEVFRHADTGKELCAHTIRGSFAGERQAVIDLLAAAHHITPDRITVNIEYRGRV